MSDKDKLKQIIGSLGLDQETESFFGKYIDDNEITPEVRENIAKLLELLAEKDEMRADLISQLAGSLDKLTDKQVELAEKTAEEMTVGLKSFVEELKKK